MTKLDKVSTFTELSTVVLSTTLDFYPILKYFSSLVSTVLQGFGIVDRFKLILALNECTF